MKLKLNRAAVADLAAAEDTVKEHTILIVDDESSNLRALASSLEREYNILTAGDGQEALELIQGMENPNEIHLIISDQRMPRLTGVEFLSHSIEFAPNAIRMILTGFTDIEAIIDSINHSKIYQFLHKPIEPHDLQLTVKRALESYKLEFKNVELIAQLQEAMKNLQVTKITPGVYWLQVPEVGLYILCGCPSDVVKHLIQKGWIAETNEDGTSFETGPNAILLSDSLIQKGQFSNLSEFPILQMLYRQGMIIPGHVNNKGYNPILIGDKKQVNAQLEYVFRGNYGLSSVEEICAAGVDEHRAKELMRIKLKFAFGNILPTEKLVDSCIVDSEAVEIRNGVYVRRVGFNRYEFSYKDRTATVDLNLKNEESYNAPYYLGYHQVRREYFAILHTGEGDGWDIHRPCMASIVIYQGDIYLIDAGPSVLQTLRSLGIDISEVKGIFHTHCHDDHFAGLPALMQADHRIKYFATPLVRHAVSKKLAALMSMDETLFARYFEICDLEEGIWNNVDGLEVKPLYSPHPVETNIFLFRVLGGEGYKTYAHWSDLTSVSVMQGMLEQDPIKPGLSEDIYDKVISDYLTPADLKKVDIGGGMIHGQVEDFTQDRSDKIILAHTALPLTPIQRAVGSEASFATMDVLIERHQNYLRRKAANYLTTYFPDLAISQLSTLLNSSIESFNPGTIMLERGQNSNHVYLVLSGTVENILPEPGVKVNLSTGSFIGDVSCLRNIASSSTYRSLSHVKVLKFSKVTYTTFVARHELRNQVLGVRDNIELLRNTWLFGESISSVTQDKIAKSMIELEVAENEEFKIAERPGLYLLNEGRIEIEGSDTQTIDTLDEGDCFGEQYCLEVDSLDIAVRASEPSKVFYIDPDSVSEVPIVHWKLLEVFAKRKAMLEASQTQAWYV
jgi:hemerythrin